MFKRWMCDWSVKIYLCVGFFDLRVIDLFYYFDREVLEDIFARYSNLALVVESIINECLNLPPNFLKEYNNVRSSDFLVSLHYLPASEIGNSGKSEHEDGNVLTFVLQDDIGGLEVHHNGEWIPVPPAEGTLVVNLGDVIQVIFFHFCYV